jgi:homoserine acetyltransferase
MKRMSLLLLLLAPLCAALHAEDQQFARIGDLKLENGEVVRDCVVGYRTFGIVNPQKSNVVVFPTYLVGLGIIACARQDNDNCCNQARVLKKSFPRNSRK